MVYVVIDEKKKKGKALLNFLKQMDEQGDFIGFADEKPKPDKAVTGKLTASEFLEKWSGIASCKE
ncbi:MAG: hypothetical protein LBR10_00465, partial [Prevotellaceae bacterium]|nr:hypothetical protein [Prevotellaceae bacterium]